MVYWSGCEQPVGIGPVRAGHAKPLRLGVHALDKGVLGAADILADRHGDVIGRPDQHHLQRIVERHDRAGLEAHLGRRLGGGMCRHLDRRSFPVGDRSVAACGIRADGWPSGASVIVRSASNGSRTTTAPAMASSPGLRLLDARDPELSVGDPRQSRSVKPMMCAGCLSSRAASPPASPMSAGADRTAGRQTLSRIVRARDVARLGQLGRPTASFGSGDSGHAAAAVQHDHDR